MNTEDHGRIIAALNRLKVAITTLTNTTTDTQSITGTTMTLANTPTFIYGVYKNGQLLTLTTDYTILTTTITFLNSLDADTISVVYRF